MNGWQSEWLEERLKERQGKIKAIQYCAQGLPSTPKKHGVQSLSSLNNQGLSNGCKQECKCGSRRLLERPADSAAPRFFKYLPIDVYRVGSQICGYSFAASIHRSSGILVILTSPATLTITQSPRLAAFLSTITLTTSPSTACN